MINIAGKLISNKVNNIRFFLNYPKIDIEEENDHVHKFVELVNKSIKNQNERILYGIFKEKVIVNKAAIIDVMCNTGSFIVYIYWLPGKCTE